MFKLAQRLIPIDTIKTVNGEFIPLHDQRLTFVPDDIYDESDYENPYGYFMVAGSNNRYKEITVCVFDVLTKQINVGILIDYKYDAEFEIGEKYLYDNGNKTVTDAILTDIHYNDFSIAIYSGAELADTYTLDKLKQILGEKQIEKNLYYCLRSWSPTYIFDIGTKTIPVKQGYKIFKKV